MTTAVSPQGLCIDYAIVKKDNTGTYLYTGFADSGTATSTSQWLISRKTLSDGTIVWTQGYSASWDNRTSAVYA